MTDKKLIVFNTPFKHYFILTLIIVIYIYIYIFKNGSDYLNPLYLFNHYTISPSTIAPLYRCTILTVSHPIPTFYAKIPTFYANIPFYMGFYSRYRAWCAGGGGVLETYQMDTRGHVLCQGLTQGLTNLGFPWLSQAEQ